MCLGVWNIGFLPIATSRYLLPKLHQERCVIYPLQSSSSSSSTTSSTTTNNTNIPSNSIIHTSKSTKKKLKKFSFTINQNFDGVIKGCHDQHGIAWLYPNIVASFRFIHNLTKKNREMNSDNNNNGGDEENVRQGKECNGVEARIMSSRSNNNSSSSDSTIDDNITMNKTSCHVKLYSIEVWNEETGELVGGELGYSVGTIYTSLTGFSREDSAGSVQLACLGKLLMQSGYEMWDLGMSLDYKITLGAKNMKRIDFVRLVKQLRTKSPSEVLDGGVELICDDKVNCKNIFYNM